MHRIYLSLKTLIQYIITHWQFINVWQIEWLEHGLFLPDYLNIEKSQIYIT